MLRNNNHGKTFKLLTAHPWPYRSHWNKEAPEPANIERL